MPDQHEGTRSERLDRAVRDLLAQTPEIEAAAVVTFDGLPMASALPASMDEDRVAAMSAALLSLGERAAEGLGRGELSQVYIEGETGTVFLISADNEAVLVAVAAKGAKAGMMLYEVKRAAAAVAAVLRADVGDLPAAEPPVYEPRAYELPAYEDPADLAPADLATADLAPAPLAADPAPTAPPILAVPAPATPVEAAPRYAAEPAAAWSTYAPSASSLPPAGASIDVPGWS